MFHKSVIATGAAALMFAVTALAPLMAQTDSEAQTDTEAEAEVEVPTPPEEDARTEVVGGATLYQRLGGYDAIAEGVDDVMARMAEDERLQRILEHLDESELRRVRQNSVDFICQETGGPCFYTGPGMAEAHEGTGITAADWERATELMAETLDARGVMGELRDELGTFLAGLRQDIVDEE
jgi:hemoglobin